MKKILLTLVFLSFTASTFASGICPGKEKRAEFCPGKEKRYMSCPSDGK